MFELLKIKKIKKLILKNHGATLNAKSLKSATLKTGYMVSLADSETQININELNIKLLKDYKKRALKNNAFVGFWLDNNILYLDISKHFNNRLEAIKEGRKNKQLAIYNLKLQKSIYLQY